MSLRRCALALVAVAALLAAATGCAMGSTASHHTGAPDELLVKAGLRPGRGHTAPRRFPEPAPRLWPLPERTRQQCVRLQAHVRFVVLCPRRVPRPTRGWKQGDPAPPVVSDIFGSLQHPQLSTPYGLEYGYSAPIEPQSGPNWRKLVWHNRPCCFLHFVVVVPHIAIPSGLTHVRLGGKRGLILYARGYGLRGSQGLYWANHTWFFWRDHGTQYAASLHSFGHGTTALLARLIRELRPADRTR